MIQSNSFPRILLVTPAAADGRYAGGEVVRKIVRAMPKGSVWWCGLRNKGNGKVENVVEEKSFPSPVVAHWRSRRSSVALFLQAQLVAWRRASLIAAWAESFRPEILWILAEEEAVNVAIFLQKRLQIPMHLTFHDVPEIFAHQFALYPSFYASFYLSRVIRLARRSVSMDAISVELIEHIEKFASCADSCRRLVFPPSVSTAMAVNSPKAECYRSDQTFRRIGLCGSLRVSPEQWSFFLTLLSSLSFSFELIVFADPEYFPDVPLPGNVTVLIRGYQETEDGLIRRFIDEQVQACYLGLWREREKDLFCRTSLSSKLATYAGAGLPVIVDGPEDSVAWKLVRKHGAGVLLKSSTNNSRDDVKETEDRNQLMRLFGNREEWQELANGSEDLCREEFNMDKNIEFFKHVLLQAC